MKHRLIPITMKAIAKAAFGVGLSLLLLAAGPHAQAKDKTPAPATGASSATTVPTGPKIRIAVTDLANAYTSDTSEGRTTYTPPNGFNEGLTEMMITSLVATGRFTVLERTALQSVLGEQKLGEGGLVTPQTAAKVGKLLGAQYLVGGAITQCNYSKSGSGVDLHLPFGFGGGGKTSSEVVLDIRLMDTTTGEIVASVQGKGEVSSSSLQLDYEKNGYGIGTKNFNNSSLGQASRKAIEDAVAQILKTSDTMAATPWEGRIADIETGTGSASTLYINAGLNAGLKVGDKLEILHTGHPITDPDTGEVIGRAKDQHIGVCQLVSVDAKLSTAKSLEGTNFQKGDTVRLLDSSSTP